MVQKNSSDVRFKHFVQGSTVADAYVTSYNGEDVDGAGGGEGWMPQKKNKTSTNSECMISTAMRKMMHNQRSSPEHLHKDIQ